MPRLARIQIFPVKSFDPVVVAAAHVLPEGALDWDRRLAFFDAEGRFVNGKRFPKLLALRARFDLSARTIELGTSPTLPADTSVPPVTFHLDNDRGALETFVGNWLGIAVVLKEAPDGGFPDDTEAPGPTIISTRTLAEVAAWYNGISIDECRLRFRANLEIDADEAFWEDHLYGIEGTMVRFRVGSVEFLGTNPCQRCAVPTRSPWNGERTAGFTDIFKQRREEKLPDWATRARFDHFYRLAVNSRAASSTGGTISVGDAVEILETLSPAG
jgi:uncharacterized protein YcbX